MERIDGDDTLPVLPAPRPIGTTGYFGPPGIGIQATQVTYEWANGIQEENAKVIESYGLTLDKTNNGQLNEAITGYVNYLSGEIADNDADITYLSGEIDNITTDVAGQFNYNNMMLIEEQYATTVEPAGPTGATWNKRLLNTEVINNIAGSSLVAGVVGLPAGDYYVEAQCLYHGGGDITLRTKARVRNTSDSISEVISDSGYLLGNGGSGYQFNLNLAGPISIVGTKTFELQHYVSTATNVDLGQSSDEGEIEVYSRLKIWKVG